MYDSFEDHLKLNGSVIFIFDEYGEIYVGERCDGTGTMLRFFQCSDLRTSFAASDDELDSSLFVEINLTSVEIQEYIKYFAQIKLDSIDELRNHVDSFQKIKAFI